MNSLSHEHYYPQKNSLPLALKLIYTGCVKDDPKWFNTPHEHDFCEILYVAGGSGSAEIGGKQYTLKTGDLIVINAGVIHAERSDPDNTLQLIFVGVDQIKIEGLPENHIIAAGRTPIIRPGKFRNKLETYFSDLIAETTSQVEYYSEIVQGLVTALVVMILRINHAYQSDDSAKMSDECEKIKAYIDTHYKSNLTLESLSETAYISKHHLAHIFKNQTGVSPIRYMIERRIDQAKSLLTQTDIPIHEIAEMVGYPDNVYFSQIFKKITGVSPSAYRRDYT